MEEPFVGKGKYAPLPFGGSMPKYHVRFLKGPNMTLRLYHEAIEEANSFEEVLTRHTDWPIQVAWDDRAATAWKTIAQPLPGIPAQACTTRKCGKRLLCQIQPSFPWLAHGNREARSDATRRQEPHCKTAKAPDPCLCLSSWRKMPL